MHSLRILGLWLTMIPAGALLYAHDGQADHIAKHGGIVFTNGPFDLEFVLLTPKGHYAVYFNDTSGEELPASTVSDVSLAIQRGALTAENVRLRIDDTGESWLGTGSAGDARISAAHVSYRFRGKMEQAEVPFSTVFHAELSTPPQVKSGVPVPLTFAVKDFFGRNTGAMQIVHEKPMHLMIVSTDLADFYHIHPMLSAGSVFRVSHVFPHGGEYRLFADFTPAGSGNHIESFTLKVQGPGRAAIPLDTSAGSTATAGNLRMTLASEKPLRAGEDIGLSMSLADVKTGAPIHDLQRYLGAWGHIAIISQDTQDFLHVHPMEESPTRAPSLPGAPSPATIRTSVGFRRPGLYKMWMQVQRAGRVTAFPFVLRVAPGAGVISQGPQAPSGSTLIKVSSAGYEPFRIPAKAGTPLKLAFFRVDAQNCGRVVKFPALGIERDLPPGQTVVIEITPRKTGALAFSCGMNMMKGELLVQ
jgi:Cupredoxin-like domain